MFCCNVGLRSLKRSEGVAVTTEGLGSSTTALDAAEKFHRCVPAVIDRLEVLALMAVTSLVLTLQHSLDVYPVCRVEHLGLLACHHLKIVERKATVKPTPSVKHQRAADRMVAMGIDGPVGDDHIGVLAVDEVAHLLVAGQRNLGTAVDLVHEEVSGTSDAAGILTLDNTDGCRLVMALARNTRFATREVDTHHVVPGIGQQANRAATTGLGIVGMGTDN